MKYRLIVEYDGTDFAGWQSQTNARAVQDVLQAALEQILRHPARVTGAGRTDAGVHALGQSAHFITDVARAPEKILRGLNAVLPADVAGKKIERVGAAFDARRDARLRRYLYQVHHSPVRPALDRHCVYHHPEAFDDNRIAPALELLRGRHDFRAFRSAQCTATRTVLDLAELKFERRGERLLFHFGCRSFLMNMIRVIMGTLLEIGQGRLEPQVIARMFAGGDRSLGGRTLEPCGLTLLEVVYPPWALAVNRDTGVKARSRR